MAESNGTYQPGWGEKKKHHHHHYESRSKERNRGLGGALRMKDKQVYYGVMAALIGVALFGLFKLGQLVVSEIKAMPMDNPETEMTVDELRIHKAEEQDAMLYADSLAQMYNIDSIRHHVQIETTPVYRPPRKNDEWYITRREWKDIWEKWKIWKKGQNE
ncbi:MAG: hypothetical protein II901_00350 [Paludibacteraceae bacterium]|nr:hypothetical protein [Paludibacteraceae bacterium]